MGISVSSGQSGSSYPTIFLIFHVSEGTVGAGTWTTVIDASAYHSTYISNAAASADGDNISFPISLPKGTYFYSIFGVRENDQAKVDYYIGTEKVISALNWYNGATDFNHRKTGSFTLSADSYDSTLKLVANGKDAGSSNYRIYHQFITIVRTA